MNDDDGLGPVNDDSLGPVHDEDELERLEGELREAAAVIDPLPAELSAIAVEAYALQDRKSVV